MEKALPIKSFYGYAMAQTAELCIEVCLRMSFIPMK